MCKHDVINIQHAHWLQEVVPSVRRLERVFLRATPKAACEPYSLSLAATSSSQLAHVQI